MLRLFFIFYLIFCFEGYSQKFGYVNSEFILNSMPEYKEALTEIDNLSKAWEKEVSEKTLSLREFGNNLTVNLKYEELLKKLKKSCRIE